MRFRLLLVVPMVVGSVVACGDDSANESQPDTTVASTAEAEPPTTTTTSAPTGTVVDVDGWQFELSYTGVETHTEGASPGTEWVVVTVEARNVTDRRGPFAPQNRLVTLERTSFRGGDLCRQVLPSLGDYCPLARGEFHFGRATGDRYTQIDAGDSVVGYFSVDGTRPEGAATACDYQVAWYETSPLGIGAPGFDAPHIVLRDARCDAG